jgi:murein DD-endopeptidase MepM/ murein hydrolase activator NlpD
VLFLLVVLIASFFFLYNSVYFERIAPKVLSPKQVYWNLEKPLSIKVSDESGIKYVDIYAKMPNGEREHVTQKNFLGSKEAVITITQPEVDRFIGNKDQFKIVVEAADTSKWNLFSGNKTIKEMQVVVDGIKPVIALVNSSYALIRGGSSVVVFKARDKNLVKKSVRIATNIGKKFKATPFYAEGYYVALIAWPVDADNYQLYMEAEDRAGNFTRVPLDIHTRNKQYRTSTLKLSQGFLSGAVEQIAPKVLKGHERFSSVEKFIKINEEVRAANEHNIEQACVVEEKKIEYFTIDRFYPLKNGAVVGRYGDHRYYDVNGKRVSESYHLGTDFASVKKAPLYVSSSGKVVFNQYNGIYGNNIIINHGLGLCSLYAHASKTHVKKDQRVDKDQLIANTGSTGLVMGDHLHFSILIQGVAVTPIQWLDKKWIRDSITGVIERSKKMIDAEIAGG